MYRWNLLSRWTSLKMKKHPPHEQSLVEVAMAVVQALAFP